MIFNRSTGIAALDDIPSEMLKVLLKILKVSVWIGFLWLWGALGNATSGAVQMIVLAVPLVLMLYFFWHAPQYGIISLMFFASGFLEPDFVDVRLPIAGGFEMRDILLLVLLAMLILKKLIEKNLTIPFGAIGLSLLAFFGFVLFSLIKALFFENVPTNWALGDARILSFYLIFLIVAWSINRKQDLITLLIGSFIIADLVAVIVILQQRLGAYNYLIPSMADSSWQVWEADGAVRVVPPGIVYMYFMNLISIALVFFGRYGQIERLLLLLHSAILSFALLLTFTRSAWIASLISLGLGLPIVLFAYRQYFARIFIGTFAAACLIIGLVGLWDNPQIENNAVRGIINRFETIFDDNTVETNSLQWRLFEVQEANAALLEQPLTGVGLGNFYRPLTVFQGEARGAWTDDYINYERIGRFTRYVHTSYLAVAVKLGYVALIILLGFITLNIVAGLSLYSMFPNTFARGLVLAIALGLIGLLQWSILHAHLLLASSTAVIGLMTGLLAAVYQIYVQEDVKTVIEEKTYQERWKAFKSRLRALQKGGLH